MSKLEIPISKDYVPSWGTWECIREAVQNGFDEDERGFPLTVEHKGDTLSIYNQGANIRPQALILGKTDKRGSTLRGEHGEGLTLSLLTGARNDMNIKVLTQDETWTPSIDWSDNYQDFILAVNTRKLRKKRDGVELQITLDKPTWTKTKNLFVELSDIPKDKILKCERGSLILDPKYKGYIFSKGIYVMKHKDFSYGYDLKFAALDRDRSIIGDFDLKWEISHILKEAATRYPTMFDKIYDLLEADSKEVEHAGSNFGYEIKDKIAKHFKKKHGERAMAVRNIDEAEKVAHLGKKGILVKDTLGRILDSSSKVQRMSDLGKELDYAVERFYNWPELEVDEQENLQKAAKQINQLENTNILEHTVIVDFINKDFIGCMIDNKIRIAKHILNSEQKTLKVLLHEEAHLKSGAEDGEEAFISMLQEMWAELYFKQREIKEEK